MLIVTISDYPYLVVDARYERIREDRVIRSQAVLVAIGINWDGRRCVLAVEMANRESQTSWKEFLEKLRERGLAACSLWLVMITAAAEGHS